MTKRKSIRETLLRPSTSSQSIETGAIFYAGIAGVLSLIAGLFFFQGYVPIFGRGSIGTVSLLLAAIFAFIGYFYAAYTSMERPKNASLFEKTRTLLTTLALSFVHAAIVFLITTIGFYIVQDAFYGLTIDKYASSAIVAAVVAVMSYAVYLVGAGINTIRISTALAVYLVSGVLISMITATDPYWWEMHLSSLGAGNSLSSFTFEVTLLFGGLVIISVADFIASDFEKLSSVDTKYKVVKANGIRIMLSLIGVFLAFVGIFAYDTNPLIHNISASGMVVLFVILILALPWLVPTFSRAFFTFSYSLMAAIIFCEVLFNFVGYLNLTGFEIIAFTIVFSWLIVFIRQIAAALADEVPVSTRKTRTKKV